MKKGTGERARSSKKISRKQKKIMLAVIAFAVVGISSLTAYSLSMKDVVKEWDNKIYPGVTVLGIDIGGLTKEEAQNKLTGTFNEAIDNKKLSIVAGDKQYELIYSDISPKYDISGTVEQAYKFGKDSGTLKQYLIIKSSNDKKNEIPLEFSYNEEKLKKYEEKLQKDITQPAKNATLDIGRDKVAVKPETDGTTIDLDTLDQKLKEGINGNINSDDEITLDIETTKPKITKEDLSKITGVMGSFSSDYSSSPAPRCNNIEKATAAINGTIIMPGETFSFNDIVGTRTAERGYQEAGTYVGNKVEPGIGGGICQVSTTVYRAAMKANLRSVERKNHSMVVGYAKPGLDATVADGYLDYKFKNTYDFPIYIQGSTVGKVLTYNIYGDPSALNGKTYDMVNEIIETIPPETKIVPDSSLPEGKEVSEGSGITGYKAKSYQITYENGVEVNRELISTDTYASVEIVIKKGTQPATTDAAEQPATDAAQQPTPDTTQQAVPNAGGAATKPVTPNTGTSAEPVQ